MARSRSQVKREAVQKKAAEATAGLDVPPDDEASDHGGVVLTVCWGDEKFTPVKDAFSTFTVGSFELSAKIPPGTDVRAAARKMAAMLDEVAEEQFAAKLQGFLNRLRTAQREGRR